MADFTYDEDEDLKADELPSDEEGDAITKNIRPSSPINNKKPKIPPPVLNNTLDNNPNTIQLQLSNPQSPHSITSLSPRSNASNDAGYAPDTDTQDIMAFSPHMRMRLESKHIPSKSMPTIPKYWTCQMCTFAENVLSSPVCGICGALPPVDKPKAQKQKPNMKQYNNNNNNPLIQPPHVQLQSQRQPQRQPQPQAQRQPALALHMNNMNINNGQQLYNALSPRAHQPNHYQHDLWMNQQTRQRHNHHQVHLRTVSAQIPSNVNNSNVNQILPSFLEDDEKESDQQPSYLKKISIANLVTKNDAISVLNDIPQQEKDLIVKQINKISSKKELQIELYSVKMTLMKKMKSHKTRIIALNKQKAHVLSEFAIQSKLWNKYYIVILQKLCKGYFEKLSKLIDVRIAVEKFYLQCFDLKLEKVSNAYNKLDENIDEWDINDTREYLKTTMFTISKIRTSPDVHKKKKDVEKLKLSINKMEKIYEEKKDKLNKSKVDDKKRSAYVTLCLKRVIDEFNANNKNIKLTEKYFCKMDVQENFNSFLFDQRVEIGKIVNNWLMFLKENKDKNKEILFKDVYIFIERLINTFCKLYNLESNINGKYNYREYCMRFIYPAILNLDIVNEILKDISNSEQGKKEYQMLSVHSEYTLFAHFLRLKYKL